MELNSYFGKAVCSGVMIAGLFWSVPAETPGWPVGTRFKRVTYDEFRMPVEFRTRASIDDVLIKERLAVCERVPDHVQRFLAGRGVRVLFFDGAITDLPEFSHLRGVLVGGEYVNGEKWDGIRTAYSHRHKLVVSGIIGEYHNNANDLAHELGHAADYFAKEVVGKEFSDYDCVQSYVLKYCLDLSRLLSLKREFVADRFAEFYGSPSRRVMVAEKYPDFFRPLCDFDEAVWQIGSSYSNQK